MRDRFDPGRFELPFVIDGVCMTATMAARRLMERDPGRFPSRDKAWDYLRRLHAEAMAYRLQVRASVLDRMKIERNSTGGHRLVYERDGHRIEGHWNAYIGIASLEVDGVTCYSVTEFHDASGLPVGRPFTVSVGGG